MYHNKIMCKSFCVFFFIFGLVVFAGEIEKEVTFDINTLSFTKIEDYDFVKLDPNVYYISTIPVSMHLTDFVVVAIAALGLSFLATLYPAYQASRIAPAEALRYE